MNRKLGQVIKAALVALPLALPGVALAQSAGAPTSNGTYDNTDKQNAPMDKSNQATPESSTGVTSPSDTTDKTPPAGSLDTSGAAKDTDRSTGGDINKPNSMDSDTSTTTTTRSTNTKKSIKKSTSDLDKLDATTPSDIDKTTPTPATPPSDVK